MAYLVRLTPAGRGGVATLLLTGSNAKKIFLSRFITNSDFKKNPPSSQKPYFGKLKLDNITQSEEIIARVIDTEKVEIHCHGGEMIYAAIKDSFANDGVETKTDINTDPQNRQKELALQLLPLATTTRTCQILLDQYNNALEHELTEIKKISQQIIQTTNPNDTALKNGLRLQLESRLLRLAENRILGQHLIEPYRVVLTGAANAGKSTLFNTILGYNRTITSELPGTTRDVVSAQTAIDGFLVTFFDTAGIRENNLQKIEQEGIKRTLEKITEADLVIRVIDLITLRKLNPQDDNRPDNNKSSAAEEQIIDKILTNRRTIYCYNKVELVPNLPAEFRTDNICVSAKNGDGIERLIKEISKQLIPNPPKPHEAIPLIDEYFS
ncbi:MAG: 50S ribosome-binding GTPase [Planctomycetaceae bacterium]|jgi:tRNA modification GTPase|nr:50S ribosome-binding GTPase [Planctomycetaceae bacterium]